MTPNRTNLSFSLKVMLLLSLITVESIYRKIVAPTARISEKNRPVFVLDKPHGNPFVQINLAQDTIFMRVLQNK